MSFEEPRFHYNPLTGKTGKCKAQRNPCPFGEERHFPTEHEARKAYEKTQGITPPLKKRKRTDFGPPSPANDDLPKQLLSQSERFYPGVYPQEVLEELGTKLRAQPFPVLSVFPAGSQLYNSIIPGQAVHDYDFTVLGEPHEANKVILAHKEPDEVLDVTMLGVDQLDKYIKRSSALTETMMAFSQGTPPLYQATAEKSPWMSYLSSYRPSETAYYDLLDDCITSANQQYEEPASLEKDPVQFKNFKHQVRWWLYQQRWGTGQDLNPRLTAAERERYLTILSEGRLSPYLQGRRD